MQEHFSTHIDAPAHFSKDGWTVDQIPPGTARTLPVLGGEEIAVETIREKHGFTEKAIDTSLLRVPLVEVGIV